MSPDRDKYRKDHPSPVIKLGSAAIEGSDLPPRQGDTHTETETERKEGEGAASMRCTRVKV